MDDTVLPAINTMPAVVLLPPLWEANSTLPNLLAGVGVAHFAVG